MKLSQLASRRISSWLGGESLPGATTSISSCIAACITPTKLHSTPTYGTSDNDFLAAPSRLVTRRGYTSRRYRDFIAHSHC